MIELVCALAGRLRNWCISLELTRFGGHPLLADDEHRGRPDDEVEELKVLRGVADDISD
jgi:hypothetical protein